MRFRRFLKPDILYPLLTRARQSTKIQISVLSDRQWSLFMWQGQSFNLGLFYRCRIFILCSLLILMTTISSQAFALENPPVHFTADRLDHNDASQTVSAIGDVELIQEEQILHADQVVYDLRNDRVTAIGNVSLLDKDGRVHFAEYLELSNQMKDGFVHGLTSYLTDGSRFVAADAERRDGNRLLMENASFTPCKICENNPDKEPLWQIRADKVDYDQERGSVKYKNARLEFLGVPFAYTPIFSHPDPRIKQKSGFLRPGGGWNSELGIFADAAYYWAIDETKDATFYVKPTTKQGVWSQVKYRQNFDNGYVNLEPSVAFNSDRTEEDGRIEENLTRGHMEGEGRFDLNEKWRTGFNVMRASDKEYLRLYDISTEDVLENILYAERFSGRNYTNMNAQQFHDIRLGVRPSQPDVLPSVYHSMLGEPEALLGGRWSTELGFLGLKRSADGQDVARASAELGWRHDHVTGFGLSAVTTASSRVDYYYVQDHEDALNDPTVDNDIDQVRFFPQIQTELSYPLVKNGTKAQYTVEPKVAFTTGDSINKDEIPNEDSKDFQLDVLNLFETSRVPGEDLQDEGTRITYGLGSGVFGYGGNSIQGFIGQSYQFDNSDIFPDGSGLSDNYSNYVGELNIKLAPLIDLDYRFQLDRNNLTPRRHEVQASGRYQNLLWTSRYTYSAAVDGTSFEGTREQLQTGAAYRLTPKWEVNANTLMDLGEEPGLRQANAGLLYNDECFTFGVQGVRRITDRSTGESETALLMRVGFKYLGEITAPQILLNDTTNVEE